MPLFPSGSWGTPLSGVASWIRGGGAGWTPWRNIVVRRKGTAPGAGSRDTKVPIQYVSSPVKLLLCSLPMLWHPIRSSKVSDLFKHPWNLHELTSTEAILVPRRLKPKY
jgi:hypothetical protein